MRDVTFTELERLHAVAEADIVLQMDEDAFRAFYDRTARSVWLYLSRLTGDPAAADDLLQEAYYRFLRVERPYASEAHRKNYLYRIATNLAHDRRRALLLLAYSQGSSHHEIAESLGLKTGSVKALLFRARRRLVGLLSAPATSEKES